MGTSNNQNNSNKEKMTLGSLIVILFVTWFVCSFIGVILPIVYIAALGISILFIGGYIYEKIKG